MWKFALLPTNTNLGALHLPAFLRQLFYKASLSTLSCRSLQTGKFSQMKVRVNNDGPSLQDFIPGKRLVVGSTVVEDNTAPYLNVDDLHGNNRRVYFETYGCQMNVSDTHIVWSVLLKNGFQRASTVCQSDIILVMTCAIREGAEDKIWKRLEYFKSLKRSRQRLKSSELPPIKIGILGCMAERLKTRIIEQEKMVDIVCGPDSYRDLPRLLSVTESGQAAVNVMLSHDETYADIIPVRTCSNNVSAFVSVMRGCDNMCAYCIVPFTRGRERSRPIKSIVDEVKQLSDEGYKEVVLLGQNVNSYRDTTSDTSVSQVTSASVLSDGFHTVYKQRHGGIPFAQLLRQVADVNPEMRIRFTSPHPKDFPDDLLFVIRDVPNVCRQLHLPAQSGSTRVLETMRRGYTADAYLQLVDHIRSLVPDVALSSDFIAGFCGESEADHSLTVELIRRVRYQFAYCFPYSMRQKTRASHHLVDDVSDDVKQRRHQQLVTTFRDVAEQLNQSMTGRQTVVLVESVSKRSPSAMVGRNESNVRIILPQTAIPTHQYDVTSVRSIQSGDYVVAQVTGASSQVLKATPLYHTSLRHSHNIR